MEGTHPDGVDTGLILVGGESRRFGGTKAFEEFEGRPLIVHVSAAFDALVDETVVSVATSEVEPRIRSVLPRAIVVADERPGLGPIEGFRQGFRAAHGGRVLVAPCDAPLLRAALYRLLLESLGDYDAAVPKFDVLDPVRAVYQRSPVVRALEATPTLPSPSALVDRLRAVLVGPDRIRTVDPDLASFLDVNTHNDMHAARRKARSMNE